MESPKSGAPAPKEAAPMVVDENEVFSELHHPLDEFTSSDQIEAFAEKLGQDLTHCECYPLYLQYLQGEVPTLDMLQKTVDELSSRVEGAIEKEKAAGLSDTDYEDLTQVKKILSTRMRNIRTNVGEYVLKIAQFHRIRIGVRASDPEWTKEEFVRIDTARRRAHEILLSSLTDLTTRTKSLIEEGLVTTHEIGYWNRTKPAHELQESGKLVLFDPRVVADRDYIRDWAISADIYERTNEFAARKTELQAQVKK